MSTFDELDKAVKIFRAASGVTVMQCTSEYPVLPERWGLNLIPLLRERYGVPVGLSDHSGTIFPSLAAVALGVQVAENGSGHPKIPAGKTGKIHRNLSPEIARFFLFKLAPLRRSSVAP